MPASRRVGRSGPSGYWAPIPGGPGAAAGSCAGGRGSARAPARSPSRPALGRCYCRRLRRRLRRPPRRAGSFMAAPPAAPTRPLAAHTCARRRPRAPPPSLARAPNWLRKVPGAGGGPLAGHTDGTPGPTDRRAARGQVRCARGCRGSLRFRSSGNAAGPPCLGRGDAAPSNNCGGPGARPASWLGHPSGSRGCRAPRRLGEPCGPRGPTPGVLAASLALSRAFRGPQSRLPRPSALESPGLARLATRAGVPSRPRPLRAVKLGPGLVSAPGAEPTAPGVAHQKWNRTRGRLAGPPVPAPKQGPKNSCPGQEAYTKIDSLLEGETAPQTPLPAPGEVLRSGCYVCVCPHREVRTARPCGPRGAGPRPRAGRRSLLPAPADEHTGRRGTQVGAGASSCLAGLEASQEEQPPSLPLSLHAFVSPLLNFSSTAQDPPSISMRDAEQGGLPSTDQCFSPGVRTGLPAGTASSLSGLLPGACGENAGGRGGGCHKRLCAPSPSYAPPDTPWQRLWVTRSLANERGTLCFFAFSSSLRPHLGSPDDSRKGTPHSGHQRSEGAGAAARKLRDKRDPASRSLGVQSAVSTAESARPGRVQHRGQRPAPGALLGAACPGARGPLAAPARAASIVNGTKDRPASCAKTVWLQSASGDDAHRGLRDIMCVVSFLSPVRADAGCKMQKETALATLGLSADCGLALTRFLPGAVDTAAALPVSRFEPLCSGERGGNWQQIPAHRQEVSDHALGQLELRGHPYLSSSWPSAAQPPLGHSVAHPPDVPLITLRSGHRSDSVARAGPGGSRDGKCPGVASVVCRGGGARVSEGCGAVTRSAVPRAGQQDTGVGGTGSPRGPHGCPSAAGVCDGTSPPTPTVPSRSPPRRPPGAPQGGGPAARVCMSAPECGGANPCASCGSDLRVGNRRACEPNGGGPGERPRGRGAGGKHIEGGEKGNIKIHCEPHSGLTISNEPRLGCKRAARRPRTLPPVRASAAAAPDQPARRPLEAGPVGHSGASPKAPSQMPPPQTIVDLLEREWGVGAAVPEGTEPGNRGLDEGHVRTLIGTSGPRPATPVAISVFYSQPHANSRPHVKTQRWRRRTYDPAVPFQRGHADEGAEKSKRLPGARFPPVLSSVFGSSAVCAACPVAGAPPLPRVKSRAGLDPQPARHHSGGCAAFGLCLEHFLHQPRLEDEDEDEDEDGCCSAHSLSSGLYPGPLTRSCHGRFEWGTPSEGSPWSLFLL
ncbi:collagen alpha-1(I) chain-like [Muntiacus reevesi]|uniref:collagen alpha-1(I) chain-like n=1 Tax=Muntiacus reevesi TaxID=9886 RepID=UPI00330758B9